MKRKKESAHFEQRARVARALGNASRLMILDALEQGEHCVCELTELVGSDQSTVSKHLAVLREVGLVRSRREGVMTWYSIQVPCLRGFWSCVDGVLRQDLRQRQHALGKPAGGNR